MINGPGKYTVKAEVLRVTIVALVRRSGGAPPGLERHKG